MSTLKVSTLQNLSGTEVYTCKAWVNFNGTGTVAIRASGNVSSITDNGVGDYTVNLTTSMPDVNYGVAFGASRQAASNSSVPQVIYSGGSPVTRTTSALRFVNGVTGSNTYEDAFELGVAIFR